MCDCILAIKSLESQTKGTSDDLNRIVLGKRIPRRAGPSHAPEQTALDHRLIGGLEDVRTTRVMLALHAANDPVAGRCLHSPFKGDDLEDTAIGLHPPYRSAASVAGATPGPAIY